MQWLHNMTEDETFLVLQRPSISQMIYLYIEYMSCWKNPYNGMTWEMHREKFFIDHGWTWFSFSEARREYFGLDGQ